MTRKSMLPVVTEEHGSGVTRHPAFGVITTNEVRSSGPVHLYGVAAPVTRWVRLVISTAEDVRTDRYPHSRAHRYATRRLIEVNLTHADLVGLISSMGSGGDTPVTITVRPKDPFKLEVTPELEVPATEVDNMRKAIRGSVDESMSDLTETVKALEALVQKGKGAVSKKELTRLVGKLESVARNTASNLDYAVQQAQDATGKLVEHARVTADTFVNAKAREVGFRTLGDFARVADVWQLKLPNSTRKTGKED